RVLFRSQPLQRAHLDHLPSELRVPRPFGSEHRRWQTAENPLGRTACRGELHLRVEHVGHHTGHVLLHTPRRWQAERETGREGELTLALSTVHPWKYAHRPGVIVGAMCLFALPSRDGESGDWERWC